jgi:Protein of unknown function (DUF2924)
MLQRFIDPAAVEAEIDRVRSLTGDALRRRWRAVFGRPVPQHLTADLLRRMIANRLQEEAFGTLDRATLKLLDGLARRDGSRSAERNLKIGTVLVRDYRGRRHTVTVGPDGYVWEGQPYSSLSAIARAITGTAWSGPRFFALKSSTPTERPEAAHGPASSPAPIIRRASTASPRNPTGALAAPEPSDPQE